MSHQSVSQKNKFHPDNMKRQSMLVSEYIDRKNERLNCPGKIVNGNKMMVQLHGHWIDVDEFDKLLPPPIVPTFSHDVNNVDSTRKWQYE